LRDDGFAIAAAAVRVAEEHVRHELRRDDEALALLPIATDVLADDRLGVTLRVAVRRVDEVAAAIDVRIEDALGLFRLRSPTPFFAEGHRAEAMRADAKTRATELT